MGWTVHCPGNGPAGYVTSDPVYDATHQHVHNSAWHAAGDVPHTPTGHGANDPTTCTADDATSDGVYDSA